MPAAPTLELEATRLQTPAAKVGAKLVLDELGQAAVFLHPPSELGPVLGHALVERSFFGPSAHILVEALDSARLPERGWSLLTRNRLHGAEGSGTANTPHWIDGIMEVPITSAAYVDGRGGLRSKKLDTNWLTVDENMQVVAEASLSGVPVLNFMLHSFSFAALEQIGRQRCAEHAVDCRGATPSQRAPPGLPLLSACLPPPVRANRTGSICSPG